MQAMAPNCTVLLHTMNQHGNAIGGTMIDTGEHNGRQAQRGVTASAPLVASQRLKPTSRTCVCRHRRDEGTTGRKSSHANGQPTAEAPHSQVSERTGAGGGGGGGMGRGRQGMGEEEAVSATRTPRRAALRRSARRH